jgi:predicted deacylase
MELDGEQLHVAERVIVSPAAGVFKAAHDLPEEIEAGTALGTLEAGGRSVAVVSPFRGRLGGMVALSGERLQPHQRVAWLRAG